MRSVRTGTHWRQPLRHLAALFVSSVALAAAGVWSSVPAQAAAPDLIVTDVRPVLTGVQATGSEVKFRATIKNQGTAATPAGVIHGVAFAINGSTVSWSDTSTASLAAGATRTVTANWGPDGNATWTAGNGSFNLRARVDDVRRIAEANETNNDRTATLAATPVKPVTNLTAKQATTLAQFQDNPVPTVRVSWTIPSGQPVGTTYRVTEHPDGDYAAGEDVLQATTSSPSATFGIMTGGTWGGCCTDGNSTTYSVTSTPATGSTVAASAWSGRCTYNRSGNSYLPQYSGEIWDFTCTGAPTFTAVDSGTANWVDAGASGTVPAAYGYERDQGFTGGTSYTRTFAALKPELNTSRYGFSKYSLPADPAQQHIVRMRFVEPTFTAAGRRVFDVRVNGVLVASRLDVFARVGLGRELVLTATVSAPNGRIDVVPTKIVDNPIIAAIETEPDSTM